MTTKRVMWRRLASGEALTADVPGLEVSQPARQLSLEADFAVPALQATFTGLVVGTAAGAGAWTLLGIDLDRAWAFAVTFCIAAAWLWRLNVTTSTLQRVESFVGVDLDGDGLQGKPSGHIVALNPYQGQQEQRRDAREGVGKVLPGS